MSKPPIQPVLADINELRIRELQARLDEVTKAKNTNNSTHDHLLAKSYLDHRIAFLTKELEEVSK